LDIARDVSVVLRRIRQRVEEARRTERQSELSILAPADVTPLMHRFIAFIDDPSTTLKVEADQACNIWGDTAPKNKSRRPLSPEQVAKILRLSEQGTHFLKEIAEEVGASVDTVCRIRKRAHADPQFVQTLRNRRQAKQQIVEQAMQLIETKKAGRIPIWNAVQLQKELLAAHGVKPSTTLLCSLLKNEANMSYKKVRRLSVQTNTERCLVLRSLYAARMLYYLQEDYRVINVDESWLSTADCRHYKWGARGKPNTLSMPLLTSKVNMVAAMDTLGNSYLSMTQSNIDTEVFLSFMIKFVALLDEEGPNWRSKTIFLIDGASYHKNTEALRHLIKMGLKILVSAPYSFDGAPVEKLFALLKKGLLDSTAMRTGRKNFRAVCGLLIRKARLIPKSSLMSLWGRSTRALMGYLMFKRV